MFWGDGNYLHLDCEGGYIDVCVLRDSSSCTLKVDALGEKGERVQKREESPEVWCACRRWGRS